MVTYSKCDPNGLFERVYNILESNTKRNVTVLGNTWSITVGGSSLYWHIMMIRCSSIIL